MPAWPCPDVLREGPPVLLLAGPAAAAPAQAQHIQDPQKLQLQHIEGVSKTAAALGRDSLLVMAVSDEGHVWQWDVALHGIIDTPAGEPLAAKAGPCEIALLA